MQSGILEEIRSISNTDIASFTGDGRDLVRLVVGIDPNQDLNGYNNPWPVGGGVNKLAPLASETINTGKGIIIASDGNGTYTITGTATAEVIVDKQLPVSYTISSGDYLHLCNNSALSGVSLGLRDTTDTGIASAATSQINRLLDLADYASSVVGYLRFYIESGVTIDMTIQPMICNSSTVIDFAPYSNECPITGHSSVNVIVSPTFNPLDGTITNIPLGTTVYGGQLDVLTGVLKIDRAYALLNDPDKWSVSMGNVDFYYNQQYADRKIFNNSYDGIICSYVPVRAGVEPYGRWMAADDYVFGIKWSDVSLADIQADASDGKIAICYELATPIEVQLTPTQIATLSGANNIWADTGDIILLEYMA